MSIKKQFLKTKPACKVTFKLSKEEANGAAMINLVGDFNGWNESADEMKALKDGSFSTSVELETGRDYQFRYLANGTSWINDPEADGFTGSGMGDSENAVIKL